MLKRSLLLLLGATLVVAMACGGGDKKNDGGDTGDEPDAPVATSAANDADAGDDPTAEPEATDEATSDESGDEEEGTSAFSSLFQSALGAGTGGPQAAGALGGGDQALLDYVLKSGDFPDGYTPLGEFTFSAPDGISETGGGDIAASMAASGDFTSGDISDMSMVMSMVMRFDDLTALGEAIEELDGLSEEDLQDAIAAGQDLPMGVEFTNLKLLDADGLGEGAAGMAMTIDMGELASALPHGPDGAGPAQMTMRMYFFGRGDYMGALMHLGFGETLPDVDELGLARALDSKLEAAP